jgi:hypothetical protein
MRAGNFLLFVPVFGGGHRPQLLKREATPVGTLVSLMKTPTVKEENPTGGALSSYQTGFD